MGSSNGKRRRAVKYALKGDGHGGQGAPDDTPAVHPRAKANAAYPIGTMPSVEVAA